MKDKRILFITGIVLLFLMSVGLSYAYFTTTVSGNENAKDMVVEAGRLKLVYTDGPEITAMNVQPGWTITKTVTVENTGTLDAIYNLKWKELTNTITNDELVFDLNCESSTDTCSYINLENQVVPSSSDLIMGDIIIYPGEKQTLSLTFTFQELNKDQNYNQGKRFNGVLNIEETTTTNDNEYTMLAQVINTNNEPIANTTIEFLNESKTGTTNDNGYVKIDNIKQGSHQMLIKDNDGNLLDKKRVTISERKESDVTDNQNIYVDISLTEFTTTIVLNDSNKVEEMSNLIIPPDECFTVSDGGITEYDPNNSDSCPKELIIPNEINGEAITKISCGYDMFSGTCSYEAFTNKNLKKIIISEGITELENYVFRNNQLTSITIPNSVTLLGDSLFENNKLTSVTIPSGVTTIGYGMFNNNMLTSITIPDNITDIGSYAFANNRLTNVIIPDSVKDIGNETFANNRLTNITISKNITIINDGVFRNNKLVSVIIPDSVTFIGMHAFRNNQLTSITIPESVTSIIAYAFADNQLTSITIPSSVVGISGTSFSNNKLPDDQAFIYKRNSDGSMDKTTILGYGGANKNPVIPSNVTTINACAFEGNQLTGVTIPSSVTSIDSYAFRYNNLKSVIIKGKTKSSEFTKYKSPNWGWADDVTCVKDNTENVENGCITWGVN